MGGVGLGRDQRSAGGPLEAARQLCGGSFGRSGVRGEGEQRHGQAQQEHGGRVADARAEVSSWKHEGLQRDIGARRTNTRYALADPERWRVGRALPERMVRVRVLPCLVRVRPRARQANRSGPARFGIPNIGRTLGCHGL